MAQLSRTAARPFPRPSLAPMDWIAFGVFLLLLLLVAAGEAIAPHSAYDFHPELFLQPPSTAHWMGTDEFGRDVFSRILAGARPAIVVAVAAAAAGVGLGCLTGLVTGYYRGVVDETVMRAMDVLMSFPGLVMALLIVAMLGPAGINVVVALVVVIWPRSARLIRSVVIEIARRDFIDAARSRGESVVYIVMRELFPKILGLVIVDFSLRVTSSILTAASLAYLGIGASAPSPSWGLMVKDGQQFMQIAPWLVIFPCLAVLMAALSSMAMGERLRRHLAGRTVR